MLQDNGGNNFVRQRQRTPSPSRRPIATGAAYAVTVLTQPAGPAQTCVVTSGSGTVASANVTSVAVSCTSATYTIGGTVSGLAGTGLVLQDNGGNNLAVAANGSFTFSTPIATGAAYAVTVLSQPSGPAQSCVVTSGSGTVASANVTSVAISCAATRTVTLYWTPVAGATSYIVLRGSSAGSMTQVDTTAGTSYTDNAAIVGQTYYYEVESIGSNGATSPASEIVSLTVQ